MRPAAALGQRGAAAQCVPRSGLLNDRSGEGQGDADGHPEAVGHQAGDDGQNAQREQSASASAPRKRRQNGGKQEEHKPGREGHHPGDHDFKKIETNIAPAFAPDGQVGGADGDGLIHEGAGRGVAHGCHGQRRGADQSRQSEQEQAAEQQGHGDLGAD